MLFCLGASVPKEDEYHFLSEEEEESEIEDEENDGGGDGLMVDGLVTKTKTEATNLVCFDCSDCIECCVLHDNCQDLKTLHREQHDNCINADLQLKSSSNSNTSSLVHHLRRCVRHRNTKTSQQKQQSPQVKQKQHRTFRRKSSCSPHRHHHHYHHNHSHQHQNSGVQVAKFVDTNSSPTSSTSSLSSSASNGNNSHTSGGGSSLANNNNSSNHHSSSHTPTTSTPTTTTGSTLLSKLGPSHLGRKFSQLRSKGTEHLQREALRKSNEQAVAAASGQSADNFQRYIRLPPSPHSKKFSHNSSPNTTHRSSSLKKDSKPFSNIVDNCETNKSLISSFTIKTLSEKSIVLPKTRGASTSPSVTSGHSNSSSSISSSGRSCCSSPTLLTSNKQHQPPEQPPPPTLVPRSANNPPPRPKADKPNKSNMSSAPPSSSTTATTARHPVAASSSTSSSIFSTTANTTNNTSASSTNNPLSSDSFGHSQNGESSTAATALPPLLSSICSTLISSSTTSSRQMSGGSSGNNSNNNTAPASSLSSSSTNQLHHSHHHQHQQFINKPPRGWLHPDHKLTDTSGVTYAVRYIGCLGVKTSMKSLDFQTRSLIAKESINRVCEAAGLKTADKKRRTDKRIAGMLADTPNMEHAGVDANLSITISYLTLTLADTGETLAKHEMPNISFASGGDTDTLDFAAYVAKDSRFERACFVLECEGGKAQEVITTIGQAFELRFNEFLKRNPLSSESQYNGGLHQPISQTHLFLPQRIEDREYYNDLPGKIPPDIVNLNGKDTSSNGKIPMPLAAPRSKNNKSPVESTHVNLIDLNDPDSTIASNSTNFGHSKSNNANNLTTKLLPTDPQYVNCMSETTSEKDPFDMQPFNNALAVHVSTLSSNDDSSKISLVNQTNQSTGQQMEYVLNSDLPKEEWFHGPISRKDSESLVIRDGDFLVRESQASPGQYVLTGMQGGSRKHLLLVDPEGVVRTKDKTFDSVSHLINYHRKNGLPIISSESALVLKHPIIAPKK